VNFKCFSVGSYSEVGWGFPLEKYRGLLLMCSGEDIELGLHELRYGKQVSVLNSPLG
jgi:hypothetical protein